MKDCREHKQCVRCKSYQDVTAPAVCYSCEMKAVPRLDINFKLVYSIERHELENLSDWCRAFEIAMWLYEDLNEVLYFELYGTYTHLQQFLYVSSETAQVAATYMSYIVSFSETHKEEI